MAFVILGLVGLIAIVNLACWIIVLIQLFKAKGPAHGIGGICCGLYTLIWGWQNADALDAANPPIAGLKYKQIVMIWTGCVGVNVLLNIVMRAVQ
jgi:hypothetical protein